MEKQKTLFPTAFGREDYIIAMKICIMDFIGVLAVSGPGRRMGNGVCCCYET